MSLVRGLLPLVIDERTSVKAQPAEIFEKRNMQSLRTFLGDLNGSVFLFLFFGTFVLRSRVQFGRSEVRINFTNNKSSVMSELRPLRLSLTPDFH